MALILTRSKILIHFFVYLISFHCNFFHKWGFKLNVLILKIYSLQIKLLYLLSLVDCKYELLHTLKCAL